MDPLACADGPSSSFNTMAAARLVASTAARALQRRWVPWPSCLRPCRCGLPHAAAPSPTAMCHPCCSLHASGWRAFKQVAARCLAAPAACAPVPPGSACISVCGAQWRVLLHAVPRRVLMLSPLLPSLQAVGACCPPLGRCGRGAAEWPSNSSCSCEHAVNACGMTGGCSIACCSICRAPAPTESTRRCRPDSFSTAPQAGGL